ncbi:DUF2842 domain-containing protein [Henriciella mobilis]|uniref:DUF2842 domain-containing protein n=1 Tax=Henriciella mobilis TaxID=2305467 RepID=A0A399R904_9PROT|nr:DUF2842 domain-containing protein [Henriciella mobilis]
MLQLKEKTLRKIVAGITLLAFIALWIFLAATIGTRITGAPDWLQLVFYVIAGVAWVIPLRPLMRWMNSRPS